VAAVDLAEAGILDVLSSDYVPASLLHGAWMLSSIPAVGTLAGAMRAVSKAAARAVGLEDRGEIAPGLRADFIRVSLFENMPVVREVYCGGRRVA
jgi:alpha-D-ribose 1-methylphosphonate 5-triphosphate diphosphatase